MITMSLCVVDQDKRGMVAGGVQVMSQRQMLAEYHQLADNYPWPLPPATHFPADLAEPAEPIVDEVVEVVEGANQADAFWICAWMGEWLRTRDRQPHAAASAWRRVKRADGTQLHRKHYDDPCHIWSSGPAAVTQGRRPERVVRSQVLPECSTGNS